MPREEPSREEVQVPANAPAADVDATPGVPPERLDALRCPKCGNDVSKGGRIRYVETIQAARSIRRVEDGHLVINSWYETEGYDEGTNPRFECHGTAADGRWCGHLWPVPDWVKPLLDWV